MLELSTYSYYIFRNADQWLRIGFHQGETSTHLTYIEERGVEPLFLGTLRLPLKIDIDTLTGIGSKKYLDTTVVTCKGIGIMMTKADKGKPFLVLQQEYFMNSKRSQEEYIECKDL